MYTSTTRFAQNAKTTNAKTTNAKTTNAKTTNAKTTNAKTTNAKTKTNSKLYQEYLQTLTPSERDAVTLESGYKIFYNLFKPEKIENAPFPEMKFFSNTSFSKKLVSYKLKIMRQSNSRLHCNQTEYHELFMACYGAILDSYSKLVASDFDGISAKDFLQVEKAEFFGICFKPCYYAGLREIDTYFRRRSRNNSREMLFEYSDNGEMLTPQDVATNGALMSTVDFDLLAIRDYLRKNAPEKYILFEAKLQGFTDLEISQHFQISRSAVTTRWGKLEKEIAKNFQGGTMPTPKQGFSIVHSSNTYGKRAVIERLKSKEFLSVYDYFKCRELAKIWQKQDKEKQAVKNRRNAYKKAISTCVFCDEK